MGAQLCHNARIERRNVIFEHSGSAGGAQTLSRDIILYADGYACEGRKLGALSTLFIDLGGFGKGVFLIEGYVSLYLILYLRYSLEHRLCKLYRAYLFIFKHCRKLRRTFFI